MDPNAASGKRVLLDDDPTDGAEGQVSRGTSNSELELAYCSDAVVPLELLDTPHDEFKHISSAQDGVVEAPADNPEDLAKRGKSLFKRFKRRNKLRYLDRAIDAQQQANELMPDNHSQKLQLLSDLGLSLWYRYENLGKLEDLENAIAVEKLARDLTPEDHPDRPERLANLAASLHSRFKRLGDIRDLEEAIEADKLARDLTPEDHPDRPKRLANLASSLRSRFERLGEIRDLEEAIEAGKRAYDLTPEGHPYRPSRLTSLAASLHSRFKRLGEIHDLEEAIEADKLARDLTPKDHPDRPLRLVNLAASLYSRFKRLGEIRDLEEAIEAGKRAYDLTPEGHPYRPSRLTSLAASLHSRFERLGEIHDLEEAIEADKLARDLTPKDHPIRPVRLANLAASLRSRFKRLGEIRDLEEAIEAEKLARDLTPENHPDRPRQLANLAASLDSRFERLGEIRDLEEAIEADKLARDLTPEDHPDRPRRLANLAVSLRSRFERLGEIGDLEEAIEAEKLARDLTPEDHPDRPRRLANLATSLHSRFEHLGEIGDLEEAIEAEKLAHDLTPEDHPDRPLRLAILAISWQRRFECLGKLSDLEAAIAAESLARDLMPEGHPNRSWQLASLGVSFKARFEYKQSKVHFDAAIHSLMEAATQSVGDPTIRLNSAQECVSLLSDYPEFSSAELVLAAHSSIIQVFPEIVWLGHSVQHRYKESAKLGNMVNTAISAFIRLQSCYQAIEWMEAGRTLVWSQITTLREPMDDLALKHPELAEDLRKVSLALLQSGSSQPVDMNNSEHSSEETEALLSHRDNVGLASSGDAGSDTVEDRHRRLTIKYQGLLKDVCKQEGFENFLHPPSIISRMPSIELLDGPVIFINVHSSSCDALALLPNGAVKHIALTDLDEDGARSLRSKWSRFLKLSNGRWRGTTSEHTPTLKTNARGLLTKWAQIVKPSNVRMRGTLPLHKLILKGRRKNTPASVLEDLWLWIVHPVLQALGYIKRDHSSLGRLPHITWCPMGPIAGLPLHAAGIYDFSRSSKSQRVFDFAVSSYTTSLSALLRSHERLRARPPPSHPNVLVVAQPATPGYAPLPHTEHESERIGSVLTNSVPTLLIDKAATMADTTAALRMCTWAHLACHGYQDPEDPTQSAFALVDRPLTLSTLMGATAENAELAFLSACETAVGDENNPEESVHLAAGMLAVGFKGVIATMWSIWDADAPVIVEVYYKKLLELRGSGELAAGYTGAAYALHEAMKVLRERVGEEKFVRWAPFVHFGV